MTQDNWWVITLIFLFIIVVGIILTPKGKWKLPKRKPDNSWKTKLLAPTSTGEDVEVILDVPPGEGYEKWLKEEEAYREKRILEIESDYQEIAGELKKMICAYAAEGSIFTAIHRTEETMTFDGSVYDKGLMKKLKESEIFNRDDLVARFLKEVHDILRHRGWTFIQLKYDKPQYDGFVFKFELGLAKVPVCEFHVWPSIPEQHRVTSLDGKGKIKVSNFISWCKNK